MIAALGAPFSPGVQSAGVFQLDDTPKIGPRILLANCRSFGMMVTRLAWMAHRLQSSIKCTMKSSVASCSAKMPVAAHLMPTSAKIFVISLTRRANGSFRISRSVDRWYFRISIRALVPGLYRCFRFFSPVCTPSVLGVLAAGGCFRGFVAGVVGCFLARAFLPLPFCVGVFLVRAIQAHVGTPHSSCDDHSAAGSLSRSRDAFELAA
mmetsp:Transcript_4464/g.12869  ORF Transcript_4464/g.12869 Transcript_4464/m.12869 type:complete len:208 (-) Transcript_4464:59-682(-)